MTYMCFYIDDQLRDQEGNSNLRTCAQHSLSPPNSHTFVWEDDMVFPDCLGVDVVFPDCLGRVTVHV